LEKLLSCYIADSPCVDPWQAADVNRTGKPYVRSDTRFVILQMVREELKLRYNIPRV